MSAKDLDKSCADGTEHNLSVYRLYRFIDVGVDRFITLIDLISSALESGERLRLGNATGAPSCSRLLIKGRRVTCGYLDPTHFSSTNYA